MIARILFFRMDWCQRHPGLMLTGVAFCLALVGAIEKALP